MAERISLGENLLNAFLAKPHELRITAAVIAVLLGAANLTLPFESRQSPEPFIMLEVTIEKIDQIQLPQIASSIGGETQSTIPTITYGPFPIETKR